MPSTSCDANILWRKISICSGVSAIKRPRTKITNPRSITIIVIINFSQCTPRIFQWALKGAVRLLTKGCAMECAQKRNKIRINSIHPGGMLTPMLEEGMEALGGGELVIDGGITAA